MFGGSCRTRVVLSPYAVLPRRAMPCYMSCCAQVSCRAGRHAVPRVVPRVQGLAKPVNDLSRGCTAPDVINTICVASIQVGWDALTAGRTADAVGWGRGRWAVCGADLGRQQTRQVGWVAAGQLALGEGGAWRCSTFVLMANTICVTSMQVGHRRADSIAVGGGRGVGRWAVVGGTCDTGGSCMGALRSTLLP